MDELAEKTIPQEVDSYNPDSPPKRRITSLVGRLDIDNYDQTITREEYYKQRASRDSNSVHPEHSSSLSEGSATT